MTRAAGEADWTDPTWLAAAHAWIRAHADVVGPIEQPRVRPWGTVLRAPTPDGDVWFKACIPLMRFEPAVVRVLARERPDAVIGLLAVDVERVWMLMSDGGERMRELVAREGSRARWLDVLPAYAELQIDLAPCADELVALGTPDHRLAALPAQAASVAALAGDVPRIERLCDELARFAIPETIQHDDLHDGQVFVRDGRPLFFDWGDACVAHPFLSMSVTLESGLGAEALPTCRAAYLAPFERWAARAELERALDVALRLGWVSRVLTTHALAAVLEPRARDEQLAQMRAQIEMFRASPAV